MTIPYNETDEMSIPGHEIQIERDEQSHDYHVIWESGRAIGLGTTCRDALEDLRGATHFYIDTIIDMELTKLGQTIPEEGR